MKLPVPRSDDPLGVIIGTALIAVLLILGALLVVR